MKIKRLFSKNTFKALFCIFLFHFFFTNAFAQQLPIPDWVKDIGGSGESKVSGIGVDKDDNVYIAGSFQNELTIDISASNPIALTSKGIYDMFIAKYTYDGQLLWAKAIGGSGWDQVNNLAVDIHGNVLIAGMSMSGQMDCDPGAGVSNLVFSGGEDAVLVKLSTDGEFAWARKVGGSDADAGHVVTADLSGNVIFVGNFGSPNINLDGWTLNPTGDKDGFMIKYDSNGAVLWAYSIGSFGLDEIKSVKTNSINEIAIMGYVGGDANLNPKGPAYPISVTGQTYFLSKYSPAGDLIWANTILGANNVSASIAINRSDEIYTNGVYWGNVTFNSQSGSQVLNSPDKDLYIAKYTNSGALTWIRSIDGTGSNPYSYYITADVDDNVYIGGFFDGTLVFGDGPSQKILTYHGGQDTFFGKYDSSGNFTWAFSFGSPCSKNYGHKIAVDSKKNVLLGGSFCGTVDFNPGNCVLNIRAQHFSSDGFIAKYNQIKFTGQPLITSFTHSEQMFDALINNNDRTIHLTVNSDADITHLNPEIAADIGAIYPLSGTYLDFTTPQKYIVSSNCIDYEWTVTISIFPSEIDVCSGTPVNLTGSPSITQASYQWEIFEDNIWLDAPGNSAAKTYIYAGLENFTGINIFKQVRRKVTGTSVSYDSQIDITIFPSTSNNTISTQNSLYCNGPVASILIHGSEPLGANNTTTYQWQQSADDLSWSDISSQKSKDLTTGEVNKNIYFRRITRSGRCDAISNSIKIQINNAPSQANAGEDQFLCNQTSIILSANSTQENETGTWSVVSPSGYNPFDDTTIHDPVAEITIPAYQEIILEWTIHNTACNTSNSDQVKVLAFKEPLVTLPANLFLNFGESVSLPAEIIGDLVTSFNFEWSPATGLNDPGSLNPTVSPNESQTYVLTVHYGSGCKIERAINITVVKDLGIPNAFSPNTDGTNDEWNIKNIEGHPNIEVTIYSRYGTQLFYSAGKYTPWNGTHNNKAVPIGTYFYIIKLNNERRTILKGSITIIR